MLNLYTQIYRYIDTTRFIVKVKPYSGIQGFRDTRIHGYVHDYRDKGIDGCRITGINGYRDTGI